MKLPIGTKILGWRLVCDKEYIIDVTKEMKRCVGNEVKPIDLQITKQEGKYIERILAEGDAEPPRRYSSFKVKKQLNEKDGGTRLLFYGLRKINTRNE